MIVALAILSLSGCVTASGSYCDVAQPVRPSVVDSLTPETARQILAENSKLEKLCGVRP